MTDRSPRVRAERRRLLLSRETLLGLVLVLAAVCVGLGRWQYGRFEDKRNRAAVIEANYDAAPVPLEQVLRSPDAALPPREEWTPVQLEGRYCAEPGCVVYVRNRQLSGEVGFWQLAPFRAEDGTTLLIVRGWVPEDSAQSVPSSPPPVPDGEITLTARLRPAEPVLDRVPPEGQAHSVNPPQLAEQLDLDADQLVTGAFGELESEQPEAERPQALEAPETGLGPHLSYAFQWWIFALFFPGALVVRLRRQLQDLDDEQAERETAAQGDGPTGADDRARDRPVRTSTRPSTDHRPRRAIHAPRRGRDEEEEDALIDQQEL
jgi:cytochrome oxidase assembly protein ShyY1